ncbi:MAG: PQQ-binding-like beta-propeller repeat protein [Planctomycetes bacterium]|nr:PQQ-binding-like beta-propeller repeat protein [Planctomycetota bacterium]
MMSRRLLPIAALLVLFALGPRLGAAEWSRFRGPSGAGISDAATVPVKWTEKDYNWKVKLPGVGHSSVVLWGNRIFLTCTDTKTARRMILCVDTADGDIVWQRDYPSGIYRHHRDNSFASSTPAADAEGVYVTWTTPAEVTLLALDHSGHDKWRRNLGRFKSMHGSGTSPIVFDDLVVLANDQQGKAFLIAVDRKTGRTRWQLERRSGLTPASTPCICRPEGGAPELIFTSTAHGITSVDPSSGVTSWEVGDVFLDRCVGSPVFAHGLIIASYGFGNRGTRLVAVRPGSKDKNIEPKLVYDITKSVPLVPTLLVKNDLLFLWADDGNVTCVRAATGEQIWRQRVDGNFYGSPVCVNDRLYCISKKGDVVVLAASDEFQLLARVPLGELTYTTPAVGNGVMYIRTYRHLISVGGKK